MRSFATFLTIGLLVSGLIALAGCGGGGGGVLDTTPPSISNLQTRYEGEQLVVQAEITDVGTGVARAWVVRKGLNASQSEMEMQLLSGSTYRVAITEATARIQVKARDGAGNVAQTEETRISPPPPPF
ncbi:MAG: hypothetical protein RMM08_05960 [Armatimonadota bacterium]|nr:hypothetical protein [Armatimonadota bacterium]